MPYLNWISDQDLEDEVRKIITVAKVGITKATSQFNKNVIDPFSIMFEMAGFNITTVSNWETNEKSRKAQKTLSNAFGTFHQSILGHVNGWTNLGTGASADLLNQNQRIIAEIKNKYNTVKGSDQANVYKHLRDLVMPIASTYHNYTSYYVETIPKPKRGLPQSYNIEFTPSDNQTKTKMPLNTRIRKIDGKSFYEIVTGDHNALEDLYNVLPTVIVNVSGITLHPIEIAKMKAYFNNAF